jgi:hypothetical protein
MYMGTGGWQIVYRPDGYEARNPMRPEQAQRFGHLDEAQRFIERQVKGGR